jgi:Dynein heavy chain, N-terminal region 2
MAANKHSFFNAESLKWQRTLTTIKSVYTLLAAVQQVWQRLEPLLAGSAEVKRELPEDAYRFGELLLTI